MRKLLFLITMLILSQYSMESRAETNQVYLSGASSRPGQEAELTINLRNAESVVAYQCTVYLPEGVTLKSISKIQDRGGQESFHTIKKNDGSVMIVGSNNGDGGSYAFTGNDGPIAKIVVSVPDNFTAGEYEVELKEIVLVNASIQSISVNDYTFKWSIVDTFTITFDSNGGTSVESITQDNGTVITPPANPTREGHTFIGWEPALPETMPVGGLTVTAQWEVNKYNITYKVDGETYKTEEVNYGTSLNGPTPVKKGMTFSGWEGLPETMPAHDVTATGTFSWSKETIDGVIYQVTDTLSNFASVVGNDDISGDVNIVSSIEIEGDTYTVTSIGVEAFYYRSGLTSITIPNSITSIGDRAFHSCKKLTSIIIPESVTNISVYAFWGCGGLKDIVVEPGNPTYDSRDNCNAIIETAKNKLVRGGRNTIIPNSVTCIGKNAFNLCSGLKNITIPESVTSIETHVFWECGDLTHITISSNVTNIEDYTFYMCGLTSITIPNGVKKIGEFAFSNCYSLTSISLPNSLTNIDVGAFQNSNNIAFVKVDNPSPAQIPVSYCFTSTRSNAVLFVPVGSKASYERSSWAYYFNEIVENFEGDVNVDEEVDVLDVVDIARFVVGSPAESFVEILADINKDSEVNLGDAVILVNDIAGDQNFVKAWNAPSQTIANDVLYMSDSNGTLSLNLENEREYTAFQFDLFVPEGAEVSQMLLNAGRKQGHQLIYNKVEEGHYRVAALSTSNQTFNGNIGELLNITLNGISGEEVRLCNIHFFDAEGQNYLFEDLESTIATDIESLHPAFSQSEGAIYDIQGRRQERMLHGINIVGGKKVVVK